MMESKEQKEECKMMAQRIAMLTASIMTHAINVVIRAQPELNTEIGISQLRSLFDEEWDLCLAVFEKAKLAGNLESGALTQEQVEGARQAIAKLQKTKPPPP